MRERLTEEELSEALEVAQGLRSLRLTAAVAELQERRRADLSAEEVAILGYVHGFMSAAAKHSAKLPGPAGQFDAKALALLDRLLAGGGK